VENHVTLPCEVGQLYHLRADLIVKPSWIGNVPFDDRPDDASSTTTTRGGTAASIAQHPPPPGPLAREPSLPGKASTSDNTSASAETASTARQTHPAPRQQAPPHPQRPPLDLRGFARGIVTGRDDDVAEARGLAILAVFHT
jgi:hypothetical protein